jgi:hypothetical protein
MGLAQTLGNSNGEAEPRLTSGGKAGVVSQISGMALDLDL